MSSLSWVVLGALVCGCSGGGELSVTDDPSTDTPGTQPTEDTGSSPGSDTGTPEPDPIDVEVSWRLHDTIRSLVYAEFELQAATTGFVEYSVDTDVWLQSPERDFVVGANEQLLLGVPYDHDVSIRLVVETDSGPWTSDVVVATTDVHPPAMPLPRLISSDETRWLPEGNYLFTSINESDGGWTGGHFWKQILDRQGRVVWALRTAGSKWTLWAETSYDGNDLMWDESTVWVFNDSSPSTVVRAKIDGTIVETYEADGLHHAWDELADETLIWGSYINFNEEHLLKLAPDGTRTTVWRCSEFEVEMLGRTGNSCHSNSWWWHEATDTYLVSFPSSAGDVRDTVLHIDADGNTLDTWGRLSTWSFAEPLTTFRYQHGVTFTDAGTLLVSTKLDYSDPFYQSSLDTLAAREYSLDYGTRTLNEVWAFGADQGIGGNTAGEAHRLANGSTLHNYGSGARTREITADGTLVWDVMWQDGDAVGSGRLQGRSVFLEDLYDFAP